MKLLRLNHINTLLVLGAFIASLFFNGIDIRFFAFVYLLLLGWILSSGITVYRKGNEVGNLLIPVSMILFWLWLGIDIVFSQVFYLSVVNFWWVGVFPLVFLAYSFSPDKEALWNQIFTLLVLTIVGLGIYALYQVFILHDQPRAIFYNKNSFAALINLLFFPVLVYFLQINNKRQLMSYTSTVFLFSLLLGLINSRGALLAFLVGLLLLFGLVIKQVSPRRLGLAALIIILGFSMATLVQQYAPQIISSNIVERLGTLQYTAGAGHGRFVIWQPAWDLFLQQPWTGIGLGTYFLAIPPTLNIDDHSAGFYVHNDYLQIALETGIPGFILLLLILLATLSRLIKSLRATRMDRPQRLHMLALFVALLT
ncbi:MAG: O-antigen ligase family protein, partial [Halobacteria archaeon]|nr:O-antigen ligase family protein [Halobacteria archaeon]